MVVGIHIAGYEKGKTNIAVRLDNEKRKTINSWIEDKSRILYLSLDDFIQAKENLT